MGPIDFAFHVLGFAAPALFLALLLPLASRLLLRRAPMAAWMQVALVLLAGLAALGAGLWFFGRDGKMLTYAGLVLAAATAQWIAARGWKPQLS